MRWPSSANDGSSYLSSRRDRCFRSRLRSYSSALSWALGERYRRRRLSLYRDWDRDRDADLALDLDLERRSSSSRGSIGVPLLTC